MKYYIDILISCYLVSRYRMWQLWKNNKSYDCTQIVKRFNGWFFSQMPFVWKDIVSCGFFNRCRKSKMIHNAPTVNQTMTCKGICSRYKSGKPSGINNRYGIGQKRCSVCEVFMIWGGKHCPCCGYVLRTKPKGTQTRQNLMILQKIKRI